MKVGVSWNLVRVLARVGSARSTIGAALDTSPARSPRRGAVGNTMWDREGPRYGARVNIREYPIRPVERAVASWPDGDGASMSTGSCWPDVSVSAQVV